MLRFLKIYLHYYVATRINRGGLGGVSLPMVCLVESPRLKTIMFQSKSQEDGAYVVNLFIKPFLLEKMPFNDVFRIIFTSFENIYAQKVLVGVI